MKSLVTGGAGFIGSHVALHCIELGHEVVVLDNLSGGLKSNVPDGAEFVHGDISNKAAVGQLLSKHKFDYVYHLAADAAEYKSHTSRAKLYRNNLYGSAVMVEAALKHRVKCFVFASSIAVYGHQSPPFDEEAAPHPSDPYGIAKYATELDLEAAQAFYGMDYVIFRPHNVYGIRQNIYDPDRNVVGIFMRQALAGQPLTIFGDGEQTRAFSHIDAVAPHIANSVNVEAAHNQVIGIGAERARTVNEIAQAVSDAVGVDLNTINLPERKETKHAYADHSKAHRLFEIEEPPFDEALLEMAGWAKAL